MPVDREDYSELVQRILQDILGSDRLRESSVFSERSYSDEPILRTGADLRREREAHTPRETEPRGHRTTYERAGTKRRPDVSDSQPARERLAKPGPPNHPSDTSRARRADEASTALVERRGGSGSASQRAGDARAERARARQEARAERPVRSARPSRADIATYLALMEQEEDQFDDLGHDSYGDSHDDNLSGGALWGWPRQPVQPKPEPLPPTLQELRSLQREKDENGSTLRGAALFVRQARVAADYTDTYELPFGPQYRYYPSYQQLPNDELRAYFTWRTAWREHRAHAMPFTYVRLVAAELVNGVGAEPGEEALSELKRLDADCLDPGSGEVTSSVHADLRTWIRDYVVYFGLDPKDAATEEERTYAQAVATLRAAERDVLARKGLRGLTAADAPAHVPSDEELWQAFGAISRYSQERSPFFRAHPEESARVGAAVFHRMAEHCAKRRKTNFVDGVVGAEESWFYSPFIGLPFLEEGEHEDVTVRITACETISYRFGRWRIHRGFERVTRDKELGHLLKAIDRQMRIDWDFGRKLKEQTVPKYVQRMIAEESGAEHKRQEEAEKRRITIDLSQLGHIREAAATTREALLVDEEREDAPEGAGTLAAGTSAFGAGAPAGVSAAGSATPAAGSSEAPADGGRRTLADSTETGARAITARDASTLAANLSTGAVPETTVDSTATSDLAGVPGSLPPEKGQPNAPNPAGLTDLELSALQRILDDKPIDDLLGPGKPMASVLVDSINEKLFDEVGDAVVEFDDADRPHMVEDYVEDVREILA